MYFIIFFIILTCDMSHVLEINLSYLIRYQGGGGGGKGQVCVYFGNYINILRAVKSTITLQI